MAQVTKPHAALLVAHGSPSSPDEPESAIAELAARVQTLLPEWEVNSATLASDGALDRAYHVSSMPPIGYPLFMADGWFVNKELRRRLLKIENRSRGADVVAPLGLDPGMPELCLAAALDAMRTNAMTPSETVLLVAAHGSPSNPRPFEAAERISRYISAKGIMGEVRLGFVDEAPFIADVAKTDGPAVCLPFFAMRAGHVMKDIPSALKAAGFDGVLAEPIGLHDRVPDMIANALVRAACSLAA